jgi:hypothetical protein
MASMPRSSSRGGFTAYASESCNRRRDTQRRLGRFVVFAEMLADLRPTSLVDQAAPFEQAGSDQGTREQGAG